MLALPKRHYPESPMLDRPKRFCPESTCWMNKNDNPQESPMLDKPKRLAFGIPIIDRPKRPPRNPPCWMSQYDLARNSSYWISQNDSPRILHAGGPKRTRIHTMCQSIPWANLEKHVPLPPQVEPLETFFDSLRRPLLDRPKHAKPIEILLNSRTV